MEAEARAILQKTLLTTDNSLGLATTIREIVTEYGPADLKLPDRDQDTSDKRLVDIEDI